MMELLDSVLYAHHITVTPTPPGQFGAPGQFIWPVFGLCWALSGYQTSNNQATLLYSHTHILVYHLASVGLNGFSV